jgi:hypothetical protein
MNSPRPSASLTFGSPAEIASPRFGTLPPAMQREAILLMNERGTPPSLIMQATGLEPSEARNLLLFPPRPFVRVIAEPVLSAGDLAANDEKPSPLPSRERKVMPPASEDELRFMARDICPILGLVPTVPVILDRAAMRHGYHGTELPDTSFGKATFNARVDAYRLLLMLRDEMTVSEVARVFKIGRNAVVGALKRVGWEAK